VIFFIRLYPR